MLLLRGVAHPALPGQTMTVVSPDGSRCRAFLGPELVETAPVSVEALAAEAQGEAMVEGIAAALLGEYAVAPGQSTPVAEVPATPEADMIPEAGAMSASESFSESTLSESTGEDAPNPSPASTESQS
jgi:hypothetical protein